MAGRVRAEVLQVLRPDQTEQSEETAEDRTALQQIRGTQFMAYLQSFQESTHESHVLKALVRSF